MNDMLIVFNVGGAMASYCEIGGKKIVIDLGLNEAFSPTNDFLLQHAKSQGRDTDKNGKFYVDQLIVSHPHKDHLSDFENFEKHFYPILITTPNDKDGMSDVDKVNRKLVSGKEGLDEKVEHFKKNIDDTDRKPPLQSCTDKLQLFYISPKIDELQLPDKDYVNNLSLVCLAQIGSNYILLPGDIMQSGFDYMLEYENNIVKIPKGTKENFSTILKKVNIFVAPHHGLKSSYNSNLVDKMENLELVIIPEKPASDLDDREVDKHYYDKPKGKRVIMQNNNDNKFKGIKTSNGHIIITEKCIRIFNKYEDLKNG